MDDEDDSAALAHQMELEAREQEELRLMNHCRKLSKELREETTNFEREMTQLKQRIRETPL